MRRNTFLRQVFFSAPGTRLGWTARATRSPNTGGTRIPEKQSQPPNNTMKKNRHTSRTAVKKTLCANVETLTIFRDRAQSLTLLQFEALDRLTIMTAYICGMAASASRLSPGCYASVEIEPIPGFGVGRLIRYAFINPERLMLEKGIFTNVCPPFSDRSIYVGPIWHVSYMPCVKTVVTCFQVSDKNGIQLK